MLTGRLLFVAFEGWNDATEAASGALKAIAEELDVETLAAVDPEDYYDFQFSRPILEFDDDGNRILSWPGAEFLHASAEVIDQRPQFENIYLLIGTEPSRRWLSFTAEIVEMVQDREIDGVVFLGSMLADVPHTRPIPIFKSSTNTKIQEMFDLEPSRYEGPVGILTVLGQALEAEGIPTISLWASVPHYVHNTTSPKAALSLVAELEKITGHSFNTTKLAEQAFEWERSIDEIAEADEEMASYVSALEKSRDEFEAEQASGDALAREFEKYLNEQPEPGSDGPKSQP